MPTFVFARARHLPELAECLERPLNPHPSYSIFRHAGRIPILADSDIANLHRAEDDAKYASDRARRKSNRHAFPIGERVRTDEAGFAGLTGVVKSGDDKFALVSFGGAFEVKIATFLLSPYDVQECRPEMGIAAKAA